MVPNAAETSGPTSRYMPRRQELVEPFQPAAATAAPPAAADWDSSKLPQDYITLPCGTCHNAAQRPSQPYASSLMRRTIAAA